MITKKISIEEKERRTAQRFMLSLKIKCRRPGQNRWALTLCNNLSGTGTMLITTQPFERDDTMEIMIPGSEYEPEAFHIIGKVVWLKKITNEKFKAGIHFTEIADKSRFIDFVCEKMLSLSLA